MANVKGSYILVTPARNEEDMLPELAEDIANQSIKPILWVIVDDGSEDKTRYIIRSLGEEFSWIEGLELEDGNETYGFQRYQRAIRKGIERALKLCEESGTDYQFLGKVDADSRPEKRYFEILMKSLDRNGSLGIVSGIHYEEGRSTPKPYPREAAILYKKECYQSIDGYYGHNANVIKAKNRGWEARTVKSAKVIHKRPVDVSKNIFSKGKYAFWVGHHPLSALFTSAYYTLLEGGPKKGVSYLAGYIESLASRESKLEDPEIRRHYERSPNQLFEKVMEYAGIENTKKKDDYGGISDA